jgi:hypothetical protein
LGGFAEKEGIMKLIPHTERLNYDLMWKCSCTKWNHEDADSCAKCARTKPLQPDDARSKIHFLRMVDTVIAYAEDHGMNAFAPVILRAIIVAYGTETEGTLASMCRAFISVHLYYRQDGDRLLTFKGKWKTRK